MGEKYISMKEAAKQLNVRRQSLYHYVEVLKLERHRFPLDRQTYLDMADFEKIKKLKQEAAERGAKTSAESGATTDEPDTLAA
jgi:hypothetical protein